MFVNALALLTLGIIGASQAGAAPLKASQKVLSASELEQALSAYKKIATLESRFEQVKELKQLQVKLKSSGIFRLRRQSENADVEWQVSKPGYLKLRITPSTLEIFETEGKAGKPLVENQEAQARILRPLYAWLSVNSSLIAEQYLVYSEGKGKFRLDPKEAGSPIKSIHIRLDSKKLVSNITLEEASGDELRISFSNNKLAFLP